MSEYENYDKVRGYYKNNGHAGHGILPGNCSEPLPK
jgi:hypothetical protein